MDIKEFFLSFILSLIFAFFTTLIITNLKGIPYYNYYEQKYNDSYHLGGWDSKYPTGIPTGYIDQGGDKNKFYDNNKQIYHLIFGFTFAIWFSLFIIIIKIDKKMLKKKETNSI